MKEFFKYSQGYVNIDSENIYLTNSGNWSETKDLKEFGLQNQNTAKKRRILMFFMVCFTAILYYMYQSLTLRTGSIVLFLGVPFGMYFVYQYLKTELGPQFKLPLAKVKSIESNEKEITLFFLNVANEEERFVIRNPEEKGMAVMRKLKSTM